jgi:hypothetical protein
MGESEAARQIPATPGHRTGHSQSRVLTRQRLQGRPVADRPPMSERIREAALTVNSPRGLMIRRRLYRRRAVLSSVIDEAARLIDEDLDPCGGEAHVGRARLRVPARYGLVNEERRAADVEPGYSAEVPELGRAERRRVPVDCGSSVGHDQHHREKRAVTFAIRRSHPTTRYRRACDRRRQTRRHP